jgi:hypothetical protein
LGEFQFGTFNDGAPIARNGEIEIGDGKREMNIKSRKNRGETRQVEAGFEPEVCAGGNERHTVAPDAGGDLGGERILLRAGRHNRPFADAGKSDKLKGVGGLERPRIVNGIDDDAATGQRFEHAGEIGQPLTGLRIIQPDGENHFAIPVRRLVNFKVRFLLDNVVEKPPQPGTCVRIKIGTTGQPLAGRARKFGEGLLFQPGGFGTIPDAHKKKCGGLVAQLAFAEPVDGRGRAGCQNRGGCDGVGF